MTDTTPGEDVLAIPAAWRRHLHPRRGGAPGPAVRADAAAEVPGLLDAAAGALESLLAGRHGDPSRTDAARRHLHGTPDAMGAAAVAAVTATAVQGRRQPEDVHRAFAEHWAAEHGPAFAACAVLELVRTAVIRIKGGTWRGVWLGTVRRKRLDETVPAVLPHVRARLAVAGDAEYAEAVRLLAGYRRSGAQSWLVSYLLPTERAWTGECVASGFGPPDEVYPLRICALGDAAHLEALRGTELRWALTREVLVTLLDALGTGLLPFLVRALGDRRVASRERGLVLDVIAVLPSDDAFRVLLDGIGDRHARPRWSRR